MGCANTGQDFLELIFPFSSMVRTQSAEAGKGGSRSGQDQYRGLKTTQDPKYSLTLVGNSPSEDCT